MKRIKLEKPPPVRVNPKGNKPSIVEAGLWNRKICSDFVGCEMLGRRPARYMKGHIYYFDIGSNFNLVGAKHPDGANMIVPNGCLDEADFEKGTFRLDHRKRARKGITTVEAIGKKLRTKKEKLHGRTGKIQEKAETQKRVRPRIRRTNRRVGR